MIHPRMSRPLPLLPPAGDFRWLSCESAAAEGRRPAASQSELGVGTRPLGGASQSELAVGTRPLGGASQSGPGRAGGGELSRAGRDQRLFTTELYLICDQNKQQTPITQMLSNHSAEAARGTPYTYNR